MADIILENKKEMKNPTQIWQAVVATIMMLALFVGGWVTINNKVSRIEEKQEQQTINQEFVRSSMEKKIDKLDDKIDKQGSDIRQILIEIQNKADRK